MREQMEFGMPTLIENRDLEEAVLLCRELGLQFVELNMNFPMYQIPQVEETAYLKEPASKNNIYFTIHLDENLNVCDFNPLVADAYLKTVERALKAAREIGIAKECGCRCVVETKTVDALRKSVTWLKKSGYMK